MKERHPDVKHPTMERNFAGFSMILLDQNQLAITPLLPDITVTVKDAVSNVVSRPIADLQKKLDEHTKRHSVNEVNSRQLTVNQLEKDRQFPVAAFTNKVAQYHPGDLFDIQSVCLDIAKHARVLAPNLMLNFGQPLPGGGNDSGMELDSSVSYTEEELKPLFGLLMWMWIIVSTCSRLLE